MKTQKYKKSIAQCLAVAAERLRSDLCRYEYPHAPQRGLRCLPSLTSLEITAQG